MSMMADQPTTGATGTEMRGTATDTFRDRMPRWKETKPSFMTTEFWFTLAGVAALIVVYNMADDQSLDLWRTCLLSTLLGIAYIVSRGFAKSGAQHRPRRDDT